MPYVVEPPMSEPNASRQRRWHKPLIAYALFAATGLLWGRLLWHGPLNEADWFRTFLLVVVIMAPIWIAVDLVGVLIHRLVRRSNERQQFWLANQDRVFLPCRSRQ